LELSRSSLGFHRQRALRRLTISGRLRSAIAIIDSIGAVATGTDLADPGTNFRF